ncbi:MAG: methionine--tRNA ligase [Humidesulfovibrio sp.]|nr:methionine--tRNA ligase [Humidesulfovibrio sp.]
MSRFFVTTPIFYVNAKPHLGHAFTTILADSVSRFHALMGEETYFLTGTDEHGDKIVKASEAAGQSPKEYADQISALFRGLAPILGAKPNQFIRTTDPDHIKTVQKVLQKVYEAGDIYFGEYGGHYCFGCERFYTEKELVDGMCPDHKTKPEYIAEKNYFFRMSKYQGWLIEHINEHPEFIRPARYRNEVLSLLESGALEDLCISRPKSRLTWGIELPFDSDFVCYVWFDALLNYISALNYPRGERFKKFWPAANHIVAKDILKPHAVFWPTMLKAAGLQPYQSLNVHGYWLVRDTKMSKSLGNVVEPKRMVDTYGASAFRYFLLREMAFGSDASFTEEALVGRLNADLANDLGNLFNRALAMTHKYFEGKVPSPDKEFQEDAELKHLGLEAMQGFQANFGEFRTARALESLWELVRALNKYIDQTAPWTLFKNKQMARLGTVLYVVLEHMRKVAVHLWPVMPEASEKMLVQLGMPFEQEKIALPKEPEVWGVLESGVAVAQTSNLFPRVELPEPTPPAPKEATAPEAKKNKTDKPLPKEAPAPVCPAESIEFTDFQKLDLRVGTVLSAEKHPDADKLLVVQVSLGEEKPRQIVAGLADRFSPEELVGKQVVVVANLAPRKLRGFLSQGMVLVAKDAEVTRLLTAAGPVDDGGKVA